MSEIVVRLKLNEIMIDPALVTREDDPQEVKRIEEGIAIGMQPDPLLVTKSGTRYVLLGGNHRRPAWLRALGPDGEVECRVIECADFKSMLLAAAMDNRGNSNAYKPRERSVLFARLRKEGCSKKEAREAIGITEEHATVWEPLVRMPATADKPKTPGLPERAVSLETPVPPERAIAHETPVLFERAAAAETPESYERAVLDETPAFTERAAHGETPVHVERAILRDIRFHVDRLRKLLPSTWTDAREALDILADEIIKAMKKENQE